MAVQSDGRILVAGSTFDVNPGIAVMALTVDGYLDSGFGDNGQVIFEVQGESIVTTDLKVASDGSVVICATVESSDSSRYAVFTKTDSGGEPAADFGEDGVVLQEADYSIEVNGLTLLDDGKILAAGAIERDGLMQAGLLRRNDDGTPDLTFGTDGEFFLEIDEDNSVVNDIFAESGGDVLLAGAVKIEDVYQAFAVRLLENGTLDPYFAGSGIYRSNQEYDTVANAVSVQQDKTILLAGAALSGQGQDVVVWSIAEIEEPLLSSEDEVILDAQQQIILRAISVGDIVATNVITDVAGGDDAGYAIAVLESGRVVVAGSSGNGSDKDFFLAGYTNEDMTGELLSTGVSEGVVTSGYKVITTPVEDITRVSAASGGFISDPQTLSCETSCTAECGESSSSSEETVTEDADGEIPASSCYDTCLIACEGKPTVTLRGVCYSVSVHPVYDDGADDVEETTLPEDTGFIFSQDSGFVYDIVRSGQTEDGDGIGSYGSQILEITPNVKYYLRAYAVLSDDTVIYGNELNFKTDDACFIATAAYGTLLDRHVVLLRQFRDTYLMSGSFGRKVVGLYYHFSPALADIIRENIFLRGAAQLILWPLTIFALFMLKTSTVVKIIITLFTFMAVSVAGFYIRSIIAGQKRGPGSVESGM